MGRKNWKGVRVDMLNNSRVERVKRGEKVREKHNAGTAEAQSPTAQQQQPQKPLNQ